MKIKALLFDKDGTLFDFQKSWGGWAKTFIEKTSNLPQERALLADALRFNLPEGKFFPDSPVIAGTLEEIVGSVVSVLPSLHPDNVRERVLVESMDAKQVPAVDLIPLFQRFREAGLRIGLATNDAEAPARAHLNAHDLLPYFDFVAGYDSGFGSKPETGMQQAFAGRMGLTSQQIVMVGDSLHDLMSGKDAGMQTIGVLTGMAAADELAGWADWILPDIGHIPSLFEQWK